jgi:hypothetical protein
MYRQYSIQLYVDSAVSGYFHSIWFHVAGIDVEFQTDFMRHQWNLCQRIMLNGAITNFSNKFWFYFKTVRIVTSLSVQYCIQIQTVAVNSEEVGISGRKDDKIVNCMVVETPTRPVQTWNMLLLQMPTCTLVCFFCILTVEATDRLWGLPSLVTNGYRGCFPRDKVAGAWSWSLTSN